MTEAERNFNIEKNPEMNRRFQLEEFQGSWESED